MEGAVAWVHREAPAMDEQEKRSAPAVSLLLRVVKGQWRTLGRGHGARPAGPLAPCGRGRRDHRSGHSTTTVAVPPIWRRASEPVTKPEVDDVQDERGPLDRSCQSGMRRSERRVVGPPGMSASNSTLRTGSAIRCLLSRSARRPQTRVVERPSASTRLPWIASRRMCSFRPDRELADLLGKR